MRRSRVIRGVELIEQLNRGERVRAKKIEKMRGAPDSRGFFG